MNNLVKHLSKQAGEYADTESLKTGEFYPCYTQKFVDLIVRECGRFTDPTARKLMMQHFGVKE